MKEITISCCEGSEKYKGECLRERCPIYKKAAHLVYRDWPYVGTGFGNLYFNPGHRTYLSEVRKIIAEDKAHTGNDTLNQEKDYLSDS